MAGHRHQRGSFSSHALAAAPVHPRVAVYPKPLSAGPVQIRGGTSTQAEGPSSRARAKHSGGGAPQPQPSSRGRPLPPGPVVGELGAETTAAVLQNRVLELALDSQGSREVQRALETSPGTIQEMLVKELEGHVNKALQSPHGNHVLQKAIAVMWPSDLFFVVPELLQFGKPRDLAKHPYGCRVLERLLEFFPARWLAGFTEDLKDGTAELARHQYGNFVVQHLLEHGDLQTRRHIVGVVCEQIVSMSSNQHACGVLDKALAYADPVEDRGRLIWEFLKQPGLLAATGSKRWGFGAAERLVSLARGTQREEVWRQLQEGAPLLQRTSTGRQLLELLPWHLWQQANIRGLEAADSTCHSHRQAPSLPWRRGHTGSGDSGSVHSSAAPAAGADSVGASAADEQLSESSGATNSSRVLILD